MLEWDPLETGLVAVGGKRWGDIEEGWDSLDQQGLAADGMFWQNDFFGAPSFNSLTEGGPVPECTPNLSVTCPTGLVSEVPAATG